MPYLNLDDRHADQPDWWKLSHGAWRLDVSGQIECSRLETDGFLETYQVSRLIPGFKQAFADELVEKGIWEVRDGKYYIPEFLNAGNWTKARRDAHKHAAALRQANKREREALKAADELAARRTSGGKA